MLQNPHNEKRALDGGASFADEKQAGKLSTTHYSRSQAASQAAVWNELIFECPACRRRSAKKLRRIFPIETSRKTIHVFGKPDAVFAALDRLGIEHRPAWEARP